MQFNVCPRSPANFDSLYGTGRWGISKVVLVVFEQTDVNNTDFNGGIGPFEIRWISTNNWAEGTGKPNNPTTDGITYNDEPVLLNPTIASLGTFVNGGTDGVVRLPLSTNATFVSNLSTGQFASIFLTATSNSTVGFTFHSRNFVDPTQFPYLEVTAVPIPRITSVLTTGTDVKISFTSTNGVSYDVRIQHESGFQHMEYVDQQHRWDGWRHHRYRPRRGSFATALL